jgi:hypothetical protein
MRPNLYELRARLGAYSKHGQVDKAAEVARELKIANVELALLGLAEDIELTDADRARLAAADGTNSGGAA